MSKLPIKDPSVKIVPSATFRKFISKHFSRDSTLPEVIRNICKNNLIGSKSANSLSASKPITFTEEEQVFLRHSNINNASSKQNMDNIKASPADEEQPESVLKTDSQIHTENMLTLSLNDLKWLHGALIETRKENPDVPFLHELLQDCKLVLPENEILERNPELEARCQKLRKEQEAKEYEAMTRNVDSVKKHMPQDTIAFQMKQINRQLIAVAQFIFSVAAGFAFGFIGIELIVGQLDFGFRLLLGIMIALIIALAEIYFLAKKLNEEYDIPTLPADSIGAERKVVESIRISAKTAVSTSGKLHKD